MVIKKGMRRHSATFPLPGAAPTEKEKQKRVLRLKQRKGRGL
jgi:hypothetical protein